MIGGILTFEQFLGKKDIGSSRIRGKWLVDKWKEAGPDLGDIELFQLGKKYDWVIYQKAYWLDHMIAFNGFKILDLCDPDWFDWNGRVVECINNVDVVTVSSPALKEYLETVTDKPIYLVEDRINFDTLPEPKKHSGSAESVVWYGYNHNFPALESAIVALARLKLKLIVISNKPYTPISSYGAKLEIINYPWKVDTVNEDIQRGDIVINPHFNHDKWRFKSNNKTTLAWALGLPVANDDRELKLFLEETNRIRESGDRYKEAKENYAVERSVEQLKEIFIKHAKAIGE